MLILSLHLGNATTKIEPVYISFIFIFIMNNHSLSSIFISIRLQYESIFLLIFFFFWTSIAFHLHFIALESAPAHNRYVQHVWWHRMRDACSKLQDENPQKAITFERGRKTVLSCYWHFVGSGSNDAHFHSFVFDSWHR